MSCLFCEKTVANDVLFCEACAETRLSPQSGDAEELPREGQLVAKIVKKKYEVTELLFQDSMIYDFKGIYYAKGRADCLSVLPLKLSRSQKNIDNFHQNIKKWTDLKIKNVLRPLGSGRQGKLHFTIHLLPQALRLTDILIEGIDVPFEWSLKIVSSIAEVIDSIHHEGLIHGHIKPAAFFLTSKGRALMTHVGLQNPLPEEILQDIVPVDVSLFAAPEQLRGELATCQSDLYSLSLIAYQLFAGVNPFETDKDINVLYKNLHEPVIPILALNGDLPPELSDIITKNLSKSPGDRSESISEFLDILRQYEQPIIPKKIEQKEPVDLSEKQKMLIELGQEHYRKGNFEKALDCWNTYLEVDPINFAVQKYRLFVEKRLVKR